MATHNLYNIFINPEFYEDLEIICQYYTLNLHSSTKAKLFYQKIMNKIEKLSFFPEKYQRVSYFSHCLPNLRKINIEHYLIIYSVDTTHKTLEILRIVRGNQNYQNLI